MKTMKCTMMVALLTLGAEVATSEAMAVTKGSALHAGTYCFQLGETIPGGPIETFKLSVSPAVNDAQHPVGRVTGFFHKTQVTAPPFLSVYAPLYGSVVTAPANGNSGSTADLLNFGLTTQSSGALSDGSGTRVIWEGAYALNLDPSTLTGRAVFKVTSTAIASGVPPTVVEVEGDDLPVKPISCSNV